MPLSNDDIPLELEIDTQSLLIKFITQGGARLTYNRMSDTRMDKYKLALVYN